MAAGMAWQTGWTLVLGFTISALLQSVVSTDQMKRALGRSGPKEIALASLAGAASVVLLLRLGSDHAHPVQEGCRTGDLAGLPVRLDQPRA